MAAFLRWSVHLSLCPVRAPNSKVTKLVQLFLTAGLIVVALFQLKQSKIGLRLGLLSTVCIARQALAICWLL